MEVISWLDVEDRTGKILLKRTRQRNNTTKEANTAIAINGLAVGSILQIDVATHGQQEKRRRSPERQSPLPTAVHDTVEESFRYFRMTYMPGCTTKFLPITRPLSPRRSRANLAPRCNRCLLGRSQRFAAVRL